MSMTLAIADTAQHVLYLAGVGGDGTSSGAVTAIVNRVIGFISVAAVAVFAVRAGLSFAKSKGAEGHKELFHIGGQFILVMVFIFSAWAIARLAGSLTFFN